MDPRSFLGELHFFVHFTHEDYIEEFGRAILEAMAMEIPVILPGSFRTTFREAAIYSEPKNVWPVICELWADEKSWQLRSEAGRAFVRRNSGWDQLASRLTELPPAQESDERVFLNPPPDSQDRKISTIP